MSHDPYAAAARVLTSKIEEHERFMLGELRIIGAKGTW